MNTEKELIPQLRFPEYTHANSFWLENLVGESIKTLAPPKKLQSNDYKETGKYPIIDQSQDFICGYSDDDSALINKDSKGLIVFGDHTCVFKFIDFPFIQGADGIKIFEPKRADEIDVRYLYQYLVSSHIESKEYKRHFSELKEKLFLYPKTINEQTKIADCLFAIDSYISSINEKVEQLKAHKKSLMQKLFLQKGQTVPEYRFPEFVDNGDWEIVKLREIAVRVKNKNKFNEQLPVLTNSATEGIVNQQDYFDREIVTRDNLSNYFIVKIDDFVYNPRISSLAPVGPISRNKIERGIISPLYTIFRFCKGCIDYFDYYFRTNCWHQYLRSIANFGARFDRMNITNEEFMNMPIPFPSVAEQQKIAECLSSIDKAIGSFLEKESQIEIYKKGLMQQLFPVKK